MTTLLFRFRHHLIDLRLPSDDYYAQTALADLDNDGQLEYVVGQRSPPDVGGGTFVLVLENASIPSPS